MGANRPLVRDTLFGSFGFDGFVLSDFFAGGDTVGSALAGQSLALPQPQYYEPALLRAAIAQGRLTTATIDDLVRRYLRVLFRFGVFDRAAYPARRHDPGQAPRAGGPAGREPRHRAAPQPPLAAAAERAPARLGGRDRQVGERVPAPERGVERRRRAVLLGHRPPGPEARGARTLRRCATTTGATASVPSVWPAGPTWRWWRPRPTCCPASSRTAPASTSTARRSRRSRTVSSARWPRPTRGRWWCSSHPARSRCRGPAGWARSWRRGGPARRAATRSPTCSSARSTRPASSP